MTGKHSLRIYLEIIFARMISGKKKEPKPKLFGLDILRWCGGLPRERVGAKKFGMSFETQGNQSEPFALGPVQFS